MCWIHRKSYSKCSCLGLVSRAYYAWNIVKRTTNANQWFVYYIPLSNLTILLLKNLTLVQVMMTQILSLQVDVHLWYLIQNTKERIEIQSFPAWVWLNLWALTSLLFKSLGAHWASLLLLTLKTAVDVKLSAFTHSVKTQVWELLLQKKPDSIKIQVNYTNP